MTDRAHSPASYRLTDLINGLVRLFILPILLFSFSLSHANAQTTPPSQSTPKIDAKQAQQLIDLLNDPTKRDAFVTTLTNLTAAQQTANSKKNLSLLDQTMNGLSTLGNDVFKELKIFPQTISHFRAIAPWITTIYHSPDLKAEIIRISLRAAIMILSGIALTLLFNIIFHKPRHHLIELARQHDHKMRQALKEKIKKEVENEKTHLHDGSLTLHEQKEDLKIARENLHNQGAFSRLMLVLKRLPYTLGYFILDIIAIAMFPIAAILIQALDPNPDANSMRAVWSITWLACVGFGLWRACLTIFFAPQNPSLRLTTLHDNTAKFFYNWLKRMGAVIAWGITALIIIHDFTLPNHIGLALAKLLALSVHIMLAIMIINGRSAVQNACEHIGQHNKHLATILKIFSKTWWIAALFFDLALWLVWAANIAGGYQLILRIFLRSCAALLIIRILSILLYGGLERLFRTIHSANVHKDAQIRILRYFPTIERILTIFLGLLTLYALAIAWGVPLTHLLGQHTLGTELLSSSITIIIALLIGVVIWEGINIGIEYHIRSLETDTENNAKSRAARIRTLQPMFRIILLAILSVIIGLTILSQLGVNTAPLLASASIFGVALGFGSQKLVQDFISGIFLLFENALTVGDAVTLNGTYGIVEKLSLRTVHVRANDGSMNIFPFSSLGQIINYNRDFARAIILADVSYDTDTDKAVQALYDITAEMRADPVFGPMIIDDLNIWGVDSLNDSSVTIKGTLPTTTAGRWPVQRQFNRRMKKTFQARDIGIPFPTRTLEITGLEQILAAKNPNSQKTEQ